MHPVTRKIVFAISFETLGVLLATLMLLALSDASASRSFLLAVISAAVALGWNFIFNSVFEAWEARQSVKGRPLPLRALHALLFEGGLTLLMVPVTAWWLGVGLRAALGYEFALIVLFVVYTYAFTWAFDHLFGLPPSAL